MPRHRLPSAPSNQFTADFDNVELGGLALKRIDPLKRYAIHFADDADNTVDLQCDFLTIPYDYADGLHSTPPWVAANRYHRGWHGTWGFEGVGLYQVDGRGESTGITSYFWPPAISPEELHTKDPA